jgi:hypothetical protein
MPKGDLKKGDLKKNLRRQATGSGLNRSILDSVKNALLADPPEKVAASEKTPSWLAQTSQSSTENLLA